MEQMTVTAKIQISVSGTDRALLDNTMSAYRDACCGLPALVFWLPLLAAHLLHAFHNM